MEESKIKINVENLKTGEHHSFDSVKDFSDFLYDLNEEEIASQESFEELIDDTEDSIIIWKQRFSPSKIIKTLDPVLFQRAYSDFIDNQIQDILYEVECCSDSTYFGDYKALCD